MLSMSLGSQRPPHCFCNWVSKAHTLQPGLCTRSHQHLLRKAPSSQAQHIFAFRCCCILFRKKQRSFLSLMDAIFLYIKPEYHQPRKGRHIPGGPGAAGFTLEWWGGERPSAVEGKPTCMAGWGWSLPGTQEFSLLSGVNSGVHVIWVVPRLVPTRLVGGFRHDRLITLAGHQCAAKTKKKQDWESCGDCLLEGRWVIPARSCFPSQQQTKQNGALSKTGFKPF